jgi:1-deoxy-D-xylulose 5-phosphate reductoisomerase
MNKGLELIEAHHLFGIAPDQLPCLSILNRSCMP